MTRRVLTVFVALAILGSVQPFIAQVRVGQATGTPAVTARGGRPASPDGSIAAERGFTSTLKLVPPPSETRPAVFPLGSEFFDFVPFWSWSMTTPVRASATGAVPSAEGELTGGLQLDVQPWRAQVYVDGVYAGLVEDFRGYYRHLDLAAGQHFVAIVAPDYRPLVIEVTISPGHTATYRGTLTRTP